MKGLIFRCQLIETLVPGYSDDPSIAATAAAGAATAISGSIVPSIQRLIHNSALEYLVCLVLSTFKEN